MSEKVKTYRDFCDKLSELDHGGSAIENASSKALLDAMSAWLSDTNGGTGFFKDPSEDNISWSDLWELIQASMIYE